MRTDLPDIAYCSIGGDLVLLETRGGRYFCLPNACIDELDADALTMIAPTITSPTLRPGPPHSASRGRPALDGSRRPGRGAFLAAALEAFTQYPTMSFGALTQRAAHYTAARLSRDPSDVLIAASAFGDRLPYAPRRGDCFYRSYLLLGTLWRQGLAADWVIGVKTWPFSAHCWVQLDDMVLDDEVERVAGFRPILIV